MTVTFQQCASKGVARSGPIGRHWMSVALTLIALSAAKAAEPARFSGDASLAMPSARQSEDQRFAITAALLPEASAKRAQSDAAGRFELNATLSAPASTKGLVTCGPIDPLIFRNGFE